MKMRTQPELLRDPPRKTVLFNNSQLYPSPKRACTQEEVRFDRPQGDIDDRKNRLEPQEGYSPRRKGILPINISHTSLPPLKYSKAVLLLIYAESSEDIPDGMVY